MTLQYVCICGHRWEEHSTSSNPDEIGVVPCPVCGTMKNVVLQSVEPTLVGPLDPETEDSCSDQISPDQDRLLLDETFRIHRTAEPTKNTHFPTIPGYEVEAQLGRGGMGAVYRARNLKLNRIEAIKTILARGDASTEELVRFQIEAESLATLQHPNIVQIHEVGESEEGPFLALEFVEGQSLDAVLHQRKLPLEEAVALVEDLARAVHAAHQRGVVHRDLKPANILLTHDGIPKITDFGLAKRLTEESNVTQPGLVVGTPSYMAPEQSRGESHLVGPQSDQYALGAILWTLMTGSPPFKGDTILEILSKVQSAQPVLSQEMKRKIPRDLETICLKCLEKEPERRYASVEAFGEDLRRYRAKEPIRARPTTPVEQFRLWMRRKPAIATLCLVLFFVLMGSAVGGILYSIQLKNALDRAERNFQLASQAVEGMLEEFTSEESALVPHLEQKQRSVLEKALQFAITLSKDKPDDAVAQRRVGYAFRRVADIQRLLGNPEAAREAYHQSIEMLEELYREDPNDVEIQIQLANAKNFLGELLRSTGHADEAQQAYEQALHFQKQLSQRFSQRPDVRMDLARTNYNLGILLKNQNQLEEAGENLDQSIQSLTQLVNEFPDDQKYAHHLARAQLNLGPVRRLQKRPEDARDAYESALEQFQNLLRKEPFSPGYQYESAVTSSNLGNLFASQGDREQAIENYRRAQNVFLQLADMFPTVPVYRVELANTLNSLGAMLASSGDYPSAIEAWRSSAESLSALIEDNPDVPAYRGDLGMTLGNLGRLHFRTGDFAKARTSLEESIESLIQILNTSPDHPVYRSALRRGVRTLAILYVQQQAFEELMELSNKLRQTVVDQGLGYLMSLEVFARSLEELEQLEGLSPEVQKAQSERIFRQAKADMSGLISAEFPEAQDLRENSNFAVLREESGITDLLDSPITPP